MCVKSAFDSDVSWHVGYLLYVYRVYYEKQCIKKKILRTHFRRCVRLPFKSALICFPLLAGWPVCFNGRAYSFLPPLRSSIYSVDFFLISRVPCRMHAGTLLGSLLLLALRTPAVMACFVHKKVIEVYGIHHHLLSRYTIAMSVCRR